MFAKEMTPSRSIIGTWRLSSTMAEDLVEYMHIGEDGRIVHFVYTDASGNDFVPMTLWTEPLGGHRYLVRNRPNSEGWEVGIIPTETGLMIDRFEQQFHLVSASDSELPNWYSRLLTKTLSRMTVLAATNSEADGGG